MDEGSGIEQNAIRALPQITENNLDLNYENLRRLGWQSFNTKVQLEHLNQVFFDKGMARQMLDEYTQNINLLKQKINPSQPEILKISALEILGKFLQYASNGNDESALLMLKSASTNINQHAITASRSNILKVEGQPMFNDPTKMNTADAFFELSQIMYASAHEGKGYQSDAAQQRLEQAKAQMRNLNMK